MKTFFQEDTDGFVGLIQLLTTLNAGCYRAFHSFNKVFERYQVDSLSEFEPFQVSYFFFRSTSINYFYITYKQWDRSVVLLMNSF